MPVVEALLSHLKASGACSTLVEDSYLDRDFTAAFSSFYATVFRRHTKLCRRFHFFQSDITDIFKISRDPLYISERLQALGDEGQYRGFIVARPLQHAPIGAAVINLPPDPEGLESHVLVRAKYDVHLLGAVLRVEGLPLTQQDSRIGACAQASIWMAGRHFHTRHRGPYFTTVDITQAATRIARLSLSRSLPAGSAFLDGDTMVQALKAMERQPFTYMAMHTSNPCTAINWGGLRPHEIINRYIDSGIPIILGLAFPNEPIGHAVVVTGHTLKKVAHDYKLPNRPTRAEFCEYFLVNDDQRGANLRMPVNETSDSGDVDYRVYPNVQAIYIPLPDKVFLPAEYAEQISWSLINSYRSEWSEFLKLCGQRLGKSADTGTEFAHQLSENKVIARTYLTYGWKYKRRALRNRIGDEFKKILIYHELPRFVWVTEFGTLESLNHIDVKERRIYAHSVIDATASAHWESRCIFHAPGLGKRWFHDPEKPFGKLLETLLPVADDIFYFPKIRRQENFDIFS